MTASAVGAAVVLVLGRREEKGFWFYVLGLPILTVLAACAAGFATQWVMILGLLLFGGVTSLAGMCCGSAGMAYAGHFPAIKVTEVVVHEKITERIRLAHD